MNQNINESTYNEEEFIKNMPKIPNSVLLKAFMKENQFRRTFCKEEDERLKYLVNHYGNNDWKKISDFMPCRTLRQCKERYEGYLSPCINKDKFSDEEDLLILEKFKEFGTKWTKISKFFVGRSGNQIKNRFNTYLKNQTKEKILNKIEEQKMKKNTTSKTFDTNINEQINQLFFKEIDYDKIQYEDDFDEDIFFNDDILSDQL